MIATLLCMRPVLNLRPLKAPMAPGPDRMFIMRTRTTKIRGVKADNSYLIKASSLE